MTTLWRFSMEYPQFGVYYLKDDMIAQLQSDIIYIGNLLNVRIEQGQYNIVVFRQGLPPDRVNILFGDKIDVDSISFEELSNILQDLVEKYDIDNFHTVSNFP